jgi:hypothetical protein
MPAAYFVHQHDWAYAVQELPSIAQRSIVQRLVDRFLHRNVDRKDAAESADPVVAAMQARLAALGKEIDRLIRLAAKEPDSARQEEYWSVARELQREAREIRKSVS